MQSRANFLWSHQMAEHSLLRLSVHTTVKIISMEIRLYLVTIFYQAQVKSYFTKVKPQKQKHSNTSQSLHSWVTNSLLAKTNVTFSIHIWRSTFQRRFEWSFFFSFPKHEQSNLRQHSGSEEKKKNQRISTPMPNVSLMHLNNRRAVFLPWNNTVHMNPRNLVYLTVSLNHP